MRLKRMVTFLPNLMYALGRQRMLKNPETLASFEANHHFPHKNHSIEWWYFSGLLKTEDTGSSFGFYATFFRIEAPFEGRILHFGLTDICRGTFSHRNLAIPFYPQHPASKTRGHIISLLGNSLIYNEDQNKLYLGVKSRGLGINLGMKLCEPVSHGRGGIIEYSRNQCGHSVYYSFPCLECSGDILHAGGMSKVSGTSWHDRQWGSFSIRNCKWDWFSVRFEKDHLYIMALRYYSSKENSFSTCTLKNEAGVMQTDHVTIKSEDVFVTKNGIRYPMGFTITLANEGRQILHIKAVPYIKDQYITSTITPSYWEGICTAECCITADFSLGGFIYCAGARLSGYSYMELTGYET